MATGSTGNSGPMGVTYIIGDNCVDFPGVQHAAAPVIFFTDLLQGASSGGVDGNGVFLTIYGLRFGTSGQVFIGGKEVAAYTHWNPGFPQARGLQTITVQPGPDIVGDDLDLFVVSGGFASNSVKFSATLTGKILFVDSTAPTGGDGSVNLPLAGLPDKARVSGGDVVYVKGQFTAGDPLFQLDDSNRPSTALNARVAYVSYPGATRAVFGGASTAGRTGVDWHGSIAHTTIAGFEFTNLGGPAELLGTRLRFVGNSLHDLTIVGGQGALWLDQCQQCEALGNYFTQVANGPCVRVVNGTEGVLIAYNEALSVDGGFSADTVAPLNNVRIYANLTNDVNFQDFTIGEEVRTASLYNNISIAAAANVFALYSPAPSGSRIIVENNTVLGANGLVGQGGTTPADIHVFRNNIGAVRTNFDYISGTPCSTGPATASGCTQGFLQAESNVYSGTTMAYGQPIGTAVVSSVETDAQVFASEALLELMSRDSPVPGTLSPAFDRGLSNGVCGDFHGVKRPQGSAYDIGAVEAPQ